MGKPRSGRKAWRGIDASAVEDAHATAALRAKSGADVATLPDDALFFVDATAAPGARPGNAYGGAAAAAAARAALRAAARAHRAAPPRSGTYKATCARVTPPSVSC